MVAFRDWSFGTGFFRSEPRNILYSTSVRRLVFLYTNQLSQLRICSVLFRECVECTILFILFISYLIRALRTTTDYCGLISGVLRRGLYRSLRHSVFGPLALPRACGWLYTADTVYPLYSQHIWCLHLEHITENYLQAYQKRNGFEGPVELRLL